MAETTIEWTDSSWNPVAGCTIVTPGCTNCYAMRMAARLEAMGTEKYAGLTRKSGRRAVWTGKVFCDEAALATPISWTKPRRVFVDSMSDLFHEGVPDGFVERVWEVMRQTPQHNYQILTKRPERLRVLSGHLPVLENVWLGTSVEDSRVLHRLVSLRRTRAAIRFVSFEPLIGSVAGASLRGIHWAIVGGESGPGARPMNPAWVEEVRLLCRAYGAAFFFKQWGGDQQEEGRSSVQR